LCAIVSVNDRAKTVQKPGLLVIGWRLLIG
jgi:hypothetical protein